ncbi:MAG TPA: hypothetical protein VLW17_11365 [Thermoanaerobaculaceae bacterium]|nr:hypothetical protein [Thermoanaerobaculaceae bacterium]
MRSTLSLAVLLVAMAIVLLLASRQTRRDFDAVRSVSFAARENVAPRPFDAAEARRLVARLRSLADTPELPADELREAASRAAGWAAALAPGAPDYHLVVNLRGAADELVDATPSLSDPHRAAARRLLDAAEAAPGAPGAGPPGAIGGVRDQLQNIQQSQREKLQDVERQTP